MKQHKTFFVKIVFLKFSSEGKSKGIKNLFIVCVLDVESVAIRARRERRANLFTSFFLAHQQSFYALGSFSAQN